MAPYLLRLILILFTLSILSISTKGILVNIPPEVLGRMQQATTDCIKLATLVSIVFADCDPVFQRYFPVGDAPFVEQVFRRIANFPPDAVLELTDFETIMQQRADVGLDRRLIDLLITYDNHPNGIQQFCDDDDDTLGFFTLLTTGEPCVCICPYTMRAFPDEEEINNPPAWARDADGNPLPGYGCDGLGDHDSDLMWFPGAILLHELTHYSNFFQDIPGWDNLIGFDSAGQRSIDDWEGPVPPFGYGAFYARILQYLSTVNPAQYAGGHEAINNADSYAAYALSVWWRWRCGREFAPSVNSADTDNRVPPPRPGASP
ncbi:uncharacterized protein Z520_11722 [Fonsecaea multimorphosa CBS 102226]|uniref:Lysine-specific metallo-endopeptidase domain-containing protein n=1 Tax=Fonsecaea multimorphosa CBS 102226 TaxID=1442371 RepID=A0A0D2I5J7_9EURO|nr:uncharacterized protein Z520_11722 [Fonsecaea multimorphosa CBS 102226]KIX92546.1 hypothetical protein Z520_11722 [Fonsecaea multimorphosa CBS 102226]OAL17815.1 hypothetical protein AYO22_11242 [Fonsecaea multimorphosa]